MPNINTNWKTKIKRKGLGIAPQEASPNLETPELVRDSRFTGRTKQLGLRVKPEFTKKLKTIAAEEDCLLVEVLEKALECYEREKQVKSDKALEKYVKIIEPKKPKPKKLFSHPHKNFTCDDCGEKFRTETAYSYSSYLSDSAITYCGECAENR